MRSVWAGDVIGGGVDGACLVQASDCLMAQRGMQLHPSGRITAPVDLVAGLHGPRVVP